MSGHTTELARPVDASVTTQKPGRAFAMPSVPERERTHAECKRWPHAFGRQAAAREGERARSLQSVPEGQGMQATVADSVVLGRYVLAAHGLQTDLPSSSFQRLLHDAQVTIAGGPRRWGS